MMKTPGRPSLPAMCHQSKVTIKMPWSTTTATIEERIHKLDSVTQMTGWKRGEISMFNPLDASRNCPDIAMIRRIRRNPNPSMTFFLKVIFSQLHNQLFSPRYFVPLILSLRTIPTINTISPFCPQLSVSEVKVLFRSRQLGSDRLPRPVLSTKQALLWSVIEVCTNAQKQWSGGVFAYISHYMLKNQG